MGPIKMSYPCTLCEYTGSSARQLSRHKAVTHVKNPLTCILCPFVTAYQTNLLRHRREVHGILGPKGNKSCKFCGFEAKDNDTLIVHQQQAHQDILKSARERFAREKKSVRGTTPSATVTASNSSANRTETVSDKQIATSTGTLREQNQYEGECRDNDEDKDFWKEGFIDNPPNLLVNLAQVSDTNEHQDSRAMNHWFRHNGTEISPVSFENSSDYGSSRASTPLPVNKSPVESADNNLAPTRIRRQYTCHDCGIRTVNPREFLYHRRDVHNQKVKIVECPYCVYACQYFQKLQRHILLVHKLETSMTPPAEVLAAAQHSSEEPMSEAKTQATQSLLQKPQTCNLEYNTSISNSATVAPLKLKVKLKKVGEQDGPPRPEASPTYSYSVIYEEAEEQPETSDADKQNVRRKYFQCESCGYKTNVHYLYKKHIKYHNAPKIKCELCDFESPYSWNVDRHARSHRMNGAYKCLKCNFSSDKPQAITIHVNQHHRDKSDVQSTCDSREKPCDEQVMEQDEEDMSHSEEEHEYQMKDMCNQSSTETFGQLQSVASNSSSKVNSMALKSVTYVRNADGKIVAKPAVVKRCKYCSFQTDTFSKLQKHETSFHPEKRFQCPLCEIRFENLVWLQRHLTHMHQEDEQANNIVRVLDMLNPKKKRPIVKAPQETLPLPSGPQTLKKAQFTPRKKLSVDKASTKCRICGYQTRWISELEKHMRVHTKEKPFSCPYCSFKSKWKGDLNRHVQKYHSRLPMPDLNAMEQQATRAFAAESGDNVIKEEIKTEIIERPDHSDNLLSDEPSKMVCEPAVVYHNELDESRVEEQEQAIEEDNMLGNQGKVKVYKCCYCEFMCTTASRFHVHFVQHLNTKPFMCSVCGHRSNWEWDVTKHIKMKSQRDSEHFNAKPVLIHDSGKRDYRKYNKYMVWVDQQEAESCSLNTNKIDFRAKRQKAEDNENVEEGEVNSTPGEHHLENEFEDGADPESIVITPDISFAFPNVSNDKDDCLNTSFQSVALQPNVPYVFGKTPQEPPSKLFYCAYCDYKHKDSKALVSHLSVHAGKKPYKCRFCGFSSNWKEVVSRHASLRHNGSVKDVDLLFKYTVSKYICRIVDDSGDIKLGPEVTTAESIPSMKTSKEWTPPMEDNKGQAPQEGQNSQTPNRLVAAGRISGFKGSFKCDLCPFRAEKAFHMDFHLKRHQPVRGADFKCPHCPYWVNAKKSLVKHIYLHDYESEVAFQDVKIEPADSISGVKQELPQDERDYEGDDDQSEMELPGVVDEAGNTPIRQSASVFKNKCDSCPFIAGTKTQLLYHKQFHRPNRNAPYKCGLCSYAVSYQHLLNQHLRVHCQEGEMVKHALEDESDEPSESDKDEGQDIPFVFVQSGNSKQKLFQCRYCPTTSKRRTYIYVHERMHTQNSNESFKCSQCAFTTKNSTAFLTHLGTHNKEPREEQDEEQQPTPPPPPPPPHTPSTPHLAHASAEESYKYIKQCEQQPQGNANSSTPTMSVVDANSIRYGNRRMFSYVCQACPAAFKSPGDLKIHSAFHGEVNYPHLCPYCTYRAKNKPQLHKHLFVHTADYITKRANSYPEGMKLTIGDALTKMKNDLQSAQKTEPTVLPAPPPLYKPQFVNQKRK